MSFWDDVIAQDAQFAFADASGFAGEPIVYKPRGTGTPTRTFNAQVFREMPTLVSGTDKPAPYFKVFVPRSAVATVGVLTVDVGGDRIAVAAKVGGPVEDHEIVAVESQDPGGFMLRLR